MALVQRLQTLYQRIAKIPDRLGVEEYKDVLITPRSGQPITINASVTRADRWAIDRYSNSEVSLDTVVLVIEVYRTLAESVTQGAKYFIDNTNYIYLWHNSDDDLVFKVYVQEYRKR
jgi:hypothetical protein